MVKAAVKASENGRAFLIPGLIEEFNDVERPIGGRSLDPNE